MPLIPFLDRYYRRENNAVGLGREMRNYRHLKAAGRDYIEESEVIVSICALCPIIKKPGDIKEQKLLEEKMVLTLGCTLQAL